MLLRTTEARNINRSHSKILITHARVAGEKTEGFTIKWLICWNKISGSVCGSVVWDVVLEGTQSSSDRLENKPNV